MKSISKKLLTALAVLVLTICTFGGAVATALAENVSVIPTKNIVQFYVEDAYLSYDKDMEYTIPVKATIMGNPVASYQMGIIVPDFLTVVDVVYEDAYEGTTSFMVNKTFGGFRVSYTTQVETLSGQDIVLFNIVCKTNMAGEFYGTFDLDYNFKVMFVDQNAQEMQHSFTFGQVNVSTEGFGSIVMGDLNLDGTVTLADVICLQRYILNNNEGVTYELFTAGDIDKNGNLDSIDVQYMQMYLVDAIPSLDDIGGNNGDNGSTGDDYQDPRYLSVSVLDARERLITYQTFTAEKGTLYPAVVGDYVAAILNRYSATVTRIQSDAYGEMTTEQAEKAVLEISDCVFVYINVVVDDYDEPQRDIVQDTYLEVETGYKIRFVLYSDYSVELYENGELIEKGKYSFNESQYDITVTLYNSYGFRAVYNKMDDCYYVTEGGDYDEPTGDYAYLPCYYLMNGRYAEVGGGKVYLNGVDQTVYEYATGYHQYGETVTVDAIYTDPEFTELLPLDATFVSGATYYVVLKEVTIVDATFTLYQQRISMTGTTSLEQVGMLKVTPTQATITYNDETAGTSYPYGMMLGQMEIRTGEYSQLLVAISGEQAIIAWEYDGSMNEVNEVYTKYAGVYEMSAFSAPFPYVITLCPNGVVKINAGGDINIMDNYFLEGDQITFSMMGNVIKGTVDIDNKVIIYNNGGNNGNNSGSGSVVDKELKETIILYDKDLGICDVFFYTDYSCEIFANGDIRVGEGNYTYTDDGGYALYIQTGDILYILYNSNIGYYEIVDYGSWSDDNDYEEEISPQFVAMMEIDGEYYPVTEWSAKCTYASTIGEYVEYLEKQMSGLKVLAMYTEDGTILDNSAPYDINAYYIGMVTDCELYGKFTLILEENGKQKVGFIEFSEDGVMYTDMNGNGGVYEYTQFLNNIEIKLGEFSQICITIAGEYAYLEYTFDGSDCVEDETLNYLVGSYGLEDIFETPMKLIIYNNGICRMVQTCCDVGMYFRYSITEKGIAIDAYGEVTEFEYDAKTNTYVCVKNYGDDYNSGSDNGYIESGKKEGYVESDLENLVGEIGSVNYN